MLRRCIAVFAVATLSTALGFALLYAPREAEAAYACSGKDVFATQNLTNVAGSSAGGTTFCLHDGTYNITSPIQVQNNDKFIGLYNDGSRPQVTTTKAKQLFAAGNSNGATIKGLKISGATGSDSCKPGCGQGIRGGDNLYVYDVWATNNMNQGIGGPGPGLRVENSLIDANGSYNFTSNPDINTSAGIKTTNSVTVLNSRITNNYWNGLWCDEQCGAMTVKNSVLSGNGKAGIHYEISTGPALITGNTIKNNGGLTRANQHDGLLIVSSAHVDAYNNTFGSNVGAGFKVIEDSRSPKVSDVSIRDNTMNSDGMIGCTISGVACLNNK